MKTLGTPWHHHWKLRWQSFQSYTLITGYFKYSIRHSKINKVFLKISRCSDPKAGLPTLDKIQMSTKGNLYKKKTQSCFSVPRWVEVGPCTLFQSSRFAHISIIISNIKINFWGFWTRCHTRAANADIRSSWIAKSFLRNRNFKILPTKGKKMGWFKKGNKEVTVER